MGAGHFRAELLNRVGHGHAYSFTGALKGWGTRPCSHKLQRTMFHPYQIERDLRCSRAAIQGMREKGWWSDGEQAVMEHSILALENAAHTVRVCRWLVFAGSVMGYLIGGLFC